jgi:hypothetical protein
LAALADCSLGGMQIWLVENLFDPEIDLTGLNLELLL